MLPLCIQERKKNPQQLLASEVMQSFTFNNLSNSTKSQKKKRPSDSPCATSACVWLLPLQSAKMRETQTPIPPAALSGPCVLWLEWKSGERHRQEGYEGRQGEEGSEREKECHQHFGCRRRQKREREGERVPRRVER